MPPFPKIEPYATGMLDVGGGHRLYWEECGNPVGTPALVLHGGPGSGCTTGARRLFDPNSYRVILIDQRGTGRSTPRVDATADLASNTTAHLLADLDVVRRHLGVDRWLVRGASWGVTLALAYAEQHPGYVIAMVLNSVATTRPKEIHWLYHGVRRYFPEEWQRFRAGVPEQARDGDLVSAYYQLLHGPTDDEVRERAAWDWCAWEDAVSPLPGGAPNPRYDDPRFRITFARIVTHYFHHQAWLEPEQLLRDAHRLSGIPAVLIHGRYDLGGPIDTAWELARAWPHAELQVVDTGHTGGGEMTDRILAATARFASLR